MAKKNVIAVLIILVYVQQGFCGYKDWPAYANTMTRQAIAVDGPNSISNENLQWVANTDPQDSNYPVEFQSVTGPILYNNRVYTYARYYEPNELSGYSDYTHNQVICYDAVSGQILWASVIDMDIWGTWAVPAVDSKNNNVLMPSGSKVFAIDAETGVINWSTALEKDIVNASVCVADDLPFARAFITDYIYSGDGKLYCINLDPESANNPYRPGDIIWSDILGATCGNTPAYKDGVVYVSSNDGSIFAYDATAVNATRIWEANDSDFAGFSSGVTVTKEGFLYASNFDWGIYGEDNSILCKIDCSNGSIVWKTLTERTSTIPVVVGDKIYISGGLFGWDMGSRPKIEAYQDHGSTVEKLWETPAGMDIGGWSSQPVYANGKLYVGSVSDGYGYSYSEIYILDVTAGIESPNFVIAHYTDQSCGNNPAVTYDSLYTIGDDGLFKFYQPAFLADIDKNGSVDFYDLAELATVWLYDGSIGVKRADLNLDGKIDFADFSLLASDWYGELN